MASIDLQYIVGINTNLSSLSTFSNVETYINPANKTSSSYKIYWQPSLGYFLEIGTFKKNFLNFKLGYNSESFRNVSFLSIIDKQTNTETKIYPTGNSAKLKIDDIYLDSAYRWDRNGYFIFGINYSFPTFIPAKSENYYQATTQGNIGINIGGGIFFWDETVACELITRYRTWSLKIYEPASQLTEDYGQGYQSQLNINLKFVL